MTARHARCRSAPALALLLLVTTRAVAQADALPAAALQVQGAWRVEQARTEPIIDRRHARLDFGADGRLSGHTSCNAFSAGYTLQGAQLRVGAVDMAPQRCGRLQLEQEDRILSALELAVTARVRPDGLLELRDADGRGVLRGTRWSPDPPLR